MRYLRYLVLATCTALLLLLIHSCTQTDNLETPPQSLGNGTVRTYIQLDEQNNPQEVGVILTEAALSGLPAHGTEVVLPLPAQASTTILNHVGFDWRSHGHAPEPIYGSPHFDVHFYTITPEERASITLVGSDLEKAYATPDPDLIPTGYILAPDSAEAQMGAHWIDPTGEEFQGEPHGFEHTMIYGFYNGEMAFIEPMVSLDFLSSKQSFAGGIAVPKRYTQAGAYPTGYSITYNEATQEYAIALTGFTQP